jgi:proteasome lid subunit RPN8/RPN11
LILTRALFGALMNERVRTLPRECCGFLLVTPRRGGEPHLRAEDLLRVDHRARRGEFEISRREWQRCLAVSERRGLRIGVLYHSHPSGDLRLSPDDRRNLGWRDLDWLILGSGEARLYSALGEEQPVRVE